MWKGSLHPMFTTYIHSLIVKIELLSEFLYTMQVYSDFIFTFLEGLIQLDTLTL